MPHTAAFYDWKARVNALLVALKPHHRAALAEYSFGRALARCGGRTSVAAYLAASLAVKAGTLPQRLRELYPPASAQIGAARSEFDYTLCCAHPPVSGDRRPIDRAVRVRLHPVLRPAGPLGRRRPPRQAPGSRPRPDRPDGPVPRPVRRRPVPRVRVARRRGGSGGRREGVVERHLVRPAREVGGRAGRRPDGAGADRPRARVARPVPRARPARVAPAGAGQGAGHVPAGGRAQRVPGRPLRGASRWRVVGRRSGIPGGGSAGVHAAGVVGVPGTTSRGCS